MKDRIPRRLIASVALAVVLLVSIGLVAQVQGVSMGYILGAASRQIKGGGAVVATINGEPVSLQTLERTKAALQASSQTPLDDSEAYRQAMDQIIRNRVLIQEARRRGLTVSEQEARDYLAEIKATAEQSPELAQMLRDEAKALGLDNRQFEEQMVAAYREGLLIDKLYKALEDETPPPSEEEIDVYLAQQPGPNAIVLIPIEFQDVAAARSTYAELQALAATQPAEQFTTTFDGYARRLGDRGMGEFVHQKFRFADANELPDYARDALDRPEGAMGLFERADGTAIVYLVLKSVAVSAEEARSAVRAHLVQEKRMAYAYELEGRLVNQADVRIFKDRLPSAARAALVDR